MDKIRISQKMVGIPGMKGVHVDEPMKYHTSFKIGGPADILVLPGSVECLLEVIHLCKEERLPWFIMGNGTNLVVRDKGIRGVVIKLFENFSQVTVEGATLTADAGALLSRVSKIALEHSLSGLEFAEGIPGTVGGAVAMNAGAYDGEIKDILESTLYIDPQGELHTITNVEHAFGYRSSIIQKENGIVIQSVFHLHEGQYEDIKAKMNDFNFRRRDKQPLEMPSAGSVFRRPVGYYTGQLIEECGLRGCCLGGAQVSQKHCGFIVNAGNGTAEDVLSLIQHIQKTIYERYGVTLETEVKVVGEE